TIGWTQQGTNRIVDFQRAGYASLAELDAAWAAASDTLASHLRRDGGPNFVLVGNCGPSSEHAYYNSWMRENFPYQQGAPCQSTMPAATSPRAAPRAAVAHRQPPHNWISSLDRGIAGDEYQPWSTTAVRFGLASAALGEGFHCFTPGEKNVQV